MVILKKLSSKEVQMHCRGGWLPRLVTLVSLAIKCNGCAFSQTNVTADAMETFGGMNQPLDNILVNIPSVRQTGTMLHGDFL